MLRLPGCTANSLPANDDGSSATAVPLGFNAEVQQTTYNSVWVNNDGNITFDGALGDYTPVPLAGPSHLIIAPFWADVDTRGSGSAVVTYGTTTYQGHAAFCVESDGVGYFESHTDKLNSFELILVSRPDRANGDFDIIFNYDQVLWETGDASGGSNGFGGTSAGVGWSLGQGSNFELPGSAVPGALIDGGPDALTTHARNSLTPGSYVFAVHGGQANGDQPTRPSATSVSCAPSSITAGQTTVCSVTVSDAAGADAGPPSGLVSFSSTGPGAFGGNGTCMLAGSGASASCSVSYTPAATASGTQTISATYAGGAVWSGSGGSAGLVVQAQQPPPPPDVPPVGVGVSVGCSPGSVLPGGSVTCDVSVVPAAGSGVPSGSVVFAVSGSAGVSGGGSCALNGSGHCSVTYNLAASASGTYTVSASYPGDTTYLPGAGITTFAAAAAAGKAANVAVVSGTVLIELASGQYVPLKGSTVSVPIGSTLDTRHGKVTISTAGDYRKPSNRHHRLQNATLSAAIFTIQQRTAAQARARLRKRERLVGIPPTDLLLQTPTGQTTKAGCRRTGTGGTGLVRAITGTGKGLFRTFGADSVTTIHNATWVVEDRCNGTLTEVGTGTATVTPTKHADRHQKTVTVHPGQGVLIKGRFL
jgi:hypothetical protein